MCIRDSLTTIVDPESLAREPVPSSLDTSVFLAAAPLDLGGIEIELLAEVEGGRAFEEKPRLRELDELASRAHTGLVLRIVPSSVCPAQMCIRDRSLTPNLAVSRVAIASTRCRLRVLFEGLSTAGLPSEVRGPS